MTRGMWVRKGLCVVTLFGVLSLGYGTALADEGHEHAGKGTYKIRPGDKLSVKFLSTKELNEEDLLVRPDGYISLQLVDEVMAAGLTPLELKNILIEKYKETVATPDLAVIVRSVNEPFKGSKHGGMQHHTSLSPLSMKAELGLKDEQVKALEPVESNYRKTIIKNRADLRVAMIDMGSLLDQKETDRSAVANKVDEISGLQKQLMMYRVDTLLKLKDILTPDQYQQFRDRLKKQMDRGMGGRMHGMGRMMGHGAMGKHGYGKGMSKGYKHGNEIRDDK